MKKLPAFFSFTCLAVIFASGCTATKNTGVAVGSGAKEAAQQVGDAVTDASITAAVKMKMADDPQVSGMKIDVDTTDGKVTLSGAVDSKSEADRAVKIARSVEGVKSVESRLVVSR